MVGVTQLGLHRRRFIDPNGECNREPRKITAKRPGHMIHLDVKKTGRIPDEKAVTAVAFLARARAWVARHGITSIERVVTDNGACHRASLRRSSRRMRAPPDPAIHAEAQRQSRADNRILAEEFLYARTGTSEEQRAQALTIWNRHYNYHRPHSAHDGKPPASATPLRVSVVLASDS